MKQTRVLKFAVTVLVISVWWSGTAAPASDGEAFECLIEPAMVVRLGSATSGVLDSVLVDRGDVIEKGQIVAELKSGIEKTNLAMARLRADSTVDLELSRLQADYEARRLNRQRSLLDRKVISRQEFERIKTEAEIRKKEIEVSEQRLLLSQKEYERAEHALEMRRIRSPLSGVVTERALSPGEYVNEDEHVFMVVQLDPLYIEAFLPLSQINKIKIGMTGTIRPEAPVGGEFTARITVKDPIVEAASGTFGVRLELPNGDGKIPAGISCTVAFDLEESAIVAD